MWLDPQETANLVTGEILNWKFIFLCSASLASWIALLIESPLLTLREIFKNNYTEVSGFSRFLIHSSSFLSEKLGCNDIRSIFISEKRWMGACEKIDQILLKSMKMPGSVF